MFSFPGIVALVIFFFVHPQEFLPILQQVPLLYIFTALAVFGMVIDLKLRLVSPQPTPELGWVLLFFAWAIGSAVATHADPAPALVQLAILFTWYFLISHGLQSLKMFRSMVWVVLALSLFLSLVGVHQFFADKGCVTLDPTVSTRTATGKPDGRKCKTPKDCEGRGAEPGEEYLCENVGLFGTTTIGGRVRYLGQLEDPNELALVVSVSLPFVFALFSIRPSKRRGLMVFLGIACVIFCVHFTRSRGGILTLLVVLAVYFVRRYRVAGATLIGAAGFTLMLLAGKGRADASASSNERMECWWEGMTMFRANPFAGVGYDAFTEYHYLTAHNSFVLTVAELGIIGFMIWMTILYMAMRIPVAAYLHFKDRDPRIRHWSLALIAAFAGMLVGSFFLSFSYRYMLWCYIGLCGAFYRVVKSYDPDWKVSFRLRDAAIVGTLSIGMVGGLFVLTRVMLN